MDHRAGNGEPNPDAVFPGCLAVQFVYLRGVCMDQKLPTFIAVQQRMFAYFDRVTPYVVVDNLKSGVYKADLYVPDLNPTYCAFANHLRFALLMSRPYKPNDMASGECHTVLIKAG